MSVLVHENIWVDKRLYDDAERQFYENQAKLLNSGSFRCPIPSNPTIKISQNPPTAVISTKKNKQKNMAPAQNVGNVANAQCSPKKSKKNKKSKNRTVSEKEGDNKSSSEREKEVSVEKRVEVDKVIEKRNSPARDLCTTNNAKNIENSDKKLSNQNKVAETRVAETHVAESHVADTHVVENVEGDTSAPKGGVNQPSGQCSLASEVAKARQHIKNSLECMDSVAALAGVPNVDLIKKINRLEKETKDLTKGMDDLRKTLQELKINFDTFTSKFPGTPAPAQAAKPAPAAAAPAKEDSDDGVDLFGSDDEEETAEAARVREERLAAYNAKKSKKPVLIAKSNIILDVKPWDDETDMAAMETAVRTVNTDGLLWGAAKLVPLAYGIHKLQISCVVEDDKVSIDWLQEELEKLEDYVQSVDIAAFNKV